MKRAIRLTYQVFARPIPKCNFKRSKNGCAAKAGTSEPDMFERPRRKEENVERVSLRVTAHIVLNGKPHASGTPHVIPGDGH